MTKRTEFRWYASDNAEIYTIREDSRDAVIARAAAERLGEELDEDGKPRLFFYIVEASKADLRIADFCLPRDPFETAGEALSETDHVNEDGECPGAFKCTPEQTKDLIRRLRAVCEDWQAAHGLHWESWSFAESRNEETIVIPLDEPAGDT